MKAITAYAPGTVANLGPGLDVLGLACTGPGDRVRATLSEEPGIRVVSSGHPDIPADPQRNTAGIAAARVAERARARGRGIDLAVVKELPLSGGQGGSAASAVAAAVAVNELLGAPLAREELLEPCLDAEEAVAGRHADNVAAALFGGIVLVRSLEPLDVVRLPVPADLRIVLTAPRQTLRTEAARSVLPASVDRSIAMRQAANVGALVLALATSDWRLLRRSIDDRIAEPARTPLLPGFAEAKAAALAAGALGCSISGSGPCAFALVADVGSASKVADAMVEGYRSRGIESVARVAEVDARGARVVEE